MRLLEFYLTLENSSFAACFYKHFTSSTRTSIRTVLSQEFFLYMLPCAFSSILGWYTWYIQDCRIRVIINKGERMVLLPAHRYLTFHANFLIRNTAQCYCDISKNHKGRRVRIPFFFSPSQRSNSVPLALEAFGLTTELSCFLTC